MAKVTVTTIADALKCAAKIKAGKACSVTETRATVLLLAEGLKSSRKNSAFLRRQVEEKAGMVRDLLSRVMR